MDTSGLVVLVCPDCVGVGRAVVVVVCGGLSVGASLSAAVGDSPPRFAQPAVPAASPVASVDRKCRRRIGVRVIQFSKMLVLLARYVLSGHSEVPSPPAAYLMRQKRHIARGSPVSTPTP